MALDGMCIEERNVAGPCERITSIQLKFTWILVLISKEGR